MTEITVTDADIAAPEFRRLKRGEKLPKGWKWVRSRIRHGWRVAIFWPEAAPNFVWVAKDFESKMKLFPWPMIQLSFNPHTQSGVWMRVTKTRAIV